MVTHSTPIHWSDKVNRAISTFQMDVLTIFSLLVLLFFFFFQRGVCDVAALFYIYYNHYQSDPMRYSIKLQMEYYTFFWRFGVCG